VGGKVSSLIAFTDHEHLVSADVVEDEQGACGNGQCRDGSQHCGRGRLAEGDGADGRPGGKALPACGRRHRSEDHLAEVDAALPSAFPWARTWGGRRLDAHGPWEAAPARPAAAPRRPGRLW
jgi:hypothetical protein